MFIFNFKLNIKKVLVIIAIIIIGLTLFKEGTEIYKKLQSGKLDYILTEKNFTSSLKLIHDHIDENIGKTIKVSGFVFKMPDFEEGNFVCGRNMILNNDEKVVGFLCKYDNANDLKPGEWVEITGTFIPGYYMTNMPVIKVDKVTKITAPTNTYVEPLNS